MNLTDNVKSARRVSTPLIAITSPDPAHTVEVLKNIIERVDGTAAPVVMWDCMQGFTAGNDCAIEAIAEMTKDPFIVSPIDMLRAAPGLPEEAALFIMNAQMFMDSAMVKQGIWNLRDLYKENKRTLFLICSHLTLPAELKNDILMLDEPLPDDGQLAKIVQRVYHDADIEQPNEDIIFRNVDGVRGLSSFLAEQNAAMALKSKKVGIDNAILWDFKKKSIENTPGITISYGGATFDDIGGQQQAKNIIGGVFNGRNRPNVVVWLDEMEKAFAGVGGGMQETSGTSADQLNMFLGELDRPGYQGIIKVGIAGTGKSATASTAGATFGVPTIRFDVGATLGSLVGQSQERIRDAFKTIHAVAGGQALFIATSNGIDNLPPELKRRFPLGPIFYDLPTEEERRIIWQIWRGKMEIDPADVQPDDTNYVGADIRNVCRIAHDFNWTLKEASEIITPVARTSPETVNRLRNQANGTWLSSSDKGLYRMQSELQVLHKKPESNGRRKLEVAD